MAACADLRSHVQPLLAYDVHVGQTLFEMDCAEDIGPILAAVPQIGGSVYLFHMLVDRTYLDLPDGAFPALGDDLQVMVGAMSICPAAVWEFASPRLQLELGPA